jgi:hypothetical protein
MSNTNLTIDLITRENLVVLHQKLNFIPNIATDYDERFATEGAKIGTSLRIRLPIQYSSATGATMATGTGADTTQQAVTLVVATQRHVPMRFTSKELTMDIDEFRERHIEPAMSQLAADIEGSALSMIDDVPLAITASTSVTLSDIIDGRQKHNDALAPFDGRCALLDSQAEADILKDTKGLFQDSSQIAKQYREGMMGRTSGYDFYMNTLIPTITTGSATASYLANKATAQTGSTIIVDTGTKTLKKGQVVTFAGTYDVHPESKATRSELKQFALTADAAATSTTLSVYPAVVASGPRQNVSQAIANNATVTPLGSASTTYKQSLLFQKGAFAFASADLEMPDDVSSKYKGRQVMDNISMRTLQQYEIVKDRFLTRLDVLYGFKRLRPGFAVKIWHT